MLDPPFTHYSSYPVLVLPCLAILAPTPFILVAKAAVQFARPRHGVAHALFARHALGHGVRGRSRGRSGRAREGSRAGPMPTAEGGRSAMDEPESVENHRVGVMFLVRH